MTDSRRLVLVTRLEAVVILALMAAGILAYVQDHAALTRQESVVTCQQHYIRTLAGTLASRAQEGDRSRAAALAYGRALTTTTAGSLAREQAYSAYATAVAQVNAALAALPLPGPGRCSRLPLVPGDLPSSGGQLKLVFMKMMTTKHQQGRAPFQPDQGGAHAGRGGVARPRRDGRKGLGGRAGPAGDPGNGDGTAS